MRFTYTQLRLFQTKTNKNLQNHASNFGDNRLVIREFGGSIMLKVRIYDFALDELGGGNGGGNNGSSSAPGPSASAPGGGFGGSAEPASFDLTKEEGHDLILRGW